MTPILVFGNPDLADDSLPLRILPVLKKRFPKAVFLTRDPNEELELPEGSESVLVLDAAVGIADVTVFNDLEAFAAPPRLSMHDFDALTNLRYLKKLGKLAEIKIIGIPPMMPAEEALEKVSATLRSNPPSENGQHSSCRGRTPG